MGKSLLLTFLLFSLIQLTGYTQQALVRGKVTSAGSPVPYAVIVIEELKKGTGSDSTGYFEIKNIPAGSYHLKVTSLGYETSTKALLLAAGEEKWIQVVLYADDDQQDEVVVTGTMKEVKKEDSPIPVEVYSSGFFKKNPTPSLFESLQIVNGVQPQLNCNVCNTGDIHINGMEGPYTMITIDGMPIVSGLSTVYGLNGIPASLVQRVEVVKGPASTLYGSEAVGGLINVITKDPSNVPKVYADVYLTSQYEMNADLAVKSKVGKATSLLGINYFNFSNKLDINDDNFTDVTLQNRISVFNKWSLERKRGKKASVAGRFVYEDRWGGELQWNRSHRGDDQVYGESIFTKRFELIGNYELPVQEDIKFQYSLTSHHQNSVYGTATYLAQQNILFGQLLWHKNIGKRHRILTGLPVRYTYYDDNTPGTSSGDSLQIRNSPGITYLPGIFVQDEVNVNDKGVFLAGIRYDYNSVHGSILSPRVSYKYNVNTANIIRLTAGNGYRVVSLFTEEHAALTGSRKLVFTEALKPERSYNVNLNYQKFITFKKGIIELDGSLFYTYFTNKIIGDFITDPDKIIYQNLIGYAVSRGITVNANVSGTFPVKLNSGITWMEVYSIQQQAADGKGKYIPQLHAPHFSGTYALTYKINKYHLTIDYTGRITGPMQLPVQQNDFRPSTSPWFSLQNIQITKKLSSFELYGGIKNLFNFIPKYPLMRPFDPFDKNVNDPVSNPNGYTFDTSYNYAPVQGIRGFIGFRFSY